MTNSTDTLLQAIENSRSALARGEKHLARQWAQKVVSLHPKSEDAWLLMAEIAPPQARMGYLKFLQTINPDNQQAREELSLSAQKITNPYNLLIPGLFFSPISTILAFEKSGDSGQVPFWLFNGLGILNAAISTMMTSYVYGFGFSWLNILLVSIVAALIGFSSTLLTFIIVDRFVMPVNTSNKSNQKHDRRALVYWSLFPLIVRQLFRLGYLVIVRAPIITVGLSGLLGLSRGITYLFAGFLQSVDLFLLWHIIILFPSYLTVSDGQAKKV